MLKSSRLTAIFEILNTIDTTTIPADKVMATWGRQNRYAGSKDRSSIAQITYDILRSRGRIDWWITRFEMPLNNRNRAIVYIHFANENFDHFFNKEDRHSSPPLERYEQEFLEELRNFDDIDHKDMPLNVLVDVQPWILESLETVYGDKLQQQLAGFDSEAPVDIRVNTLKATKEQVKEALNNEGMGVANLKHAPNGLRLTRRFPLSGLEAFKKGWFEIQDEGSQLTALLTNPKRGDKIVDFCAGAGGKTLSMAALLENTGRIIACDVSEKRLDRSGIRLKRAGVNNTERRVLTSERDKWIKRRSARFDGGFDKVVVDAPCSGTGTWRRNPDQKWRTTQTDVIELVELQANILQSASRLVAQGGLVYYITCSILAEENEQQVDNFLGNNENFKLVDIKTIWNKALSMMACPTAEKTLRLSPYTNDTDGFFIAVFERDVEPKKIESRKKDAKKIKPQKTEVKKAE